MKYGFARDHDLFPARRSDARGYRRALSAFAGRNAVLLIAFAAAAVTCVFVPLDDAYIGYFDFRTLSCLFATLAVVAAFRNIRFFKILAAALVRRCKNLRVVVLCVVGLTYFGSMILANDMALVTFLPLGYYLIRACGKKKYLAFVFVMQNVAANLGGMLTPFGNPQNLYLYSYYSIPTAEFFGIMAPPFAVAFVALLGFCFFVPAEPLVVPDRGTERLVVWRTVVYAALFATAVLIVFRVFPYYWGLLAVFVALRLLDYRALLRVDYGLLLTFCAFFVFSGNLARIPAVRDFLSRLVNASPLLVGTACSQLISNVPTAVLLSHFTSAYAPLLVAVNLGGLGTPIASLASLITLRNYRAANDGGMGRYFKFYCAINFSLLALLLAVEYPLLTLL